MKDHFEPKAQVWFKALFVVFQFLTVVILTHQISRLYIYEKITYVSDTKMLEKYFSVIGDAWKMNPITNIYLTTDIANCDDPAFKRTWGGLTHY